MKVKHITGRLEQDVAEGEQRMSRAAKGNEKYGKDGMKALAKAGREGASDEKLDTIRDKHDNYDESIEEGVMSEIDMEVGEMMDKYIQRYQSGRLDADHLMHLMDKASGLLAKRHGMEKEQALQFISDYVDQADPDLSEETPGQELGTIGAVKPDGTVEVKKADGTSTVVQQQELKPGATPNTLTMPVPKINPGEKVLAAPVAESADLTAMLRIAGLR
jgi:hypothetical protein